MADEEEADGEELFGDNMEQDYRPMPGLDRYDPEMLDDDPDNEGLMSESDRAAAEAALRRRDRAEGRNVRGMRRGLLYDDESDDEVGPALHLTLFHTLQPFQVALSNTFLMCTIPFPT